MIQSASHPVLLLSGGEQQIFDPGELREELVRCFLGAGLEESCYLAGDIVLAVEYALEHSDRQEKVFSRAELDDMVVRILENTGFGDVSRLYRRGTPDRVRMTCAADLSGVSVVLRKYFAGSQEHLASLAGQVTTALAALRIREASPELMVELARHYDASSPEMPVPVPVQPAVRQVDEHFILTLAEVQTAFPGGVPGLEGEICRLHGVGRLFPSVRIAFFMNRFAQSRQWEAPVLEMMIQPELAAAGRVLTEARNRILGMYREVTGKPEAMLPFYLSIPDMDDFLATYLQCSPEGLPALRKTVCDMLVSGISVPLEKIRTGI